MRETEPLPVHIWIAADNPGGAEILAAYALKNRSEHRFNFTLSGAATDIFKRRLPRMASEPIDNLANLPRDKTLLLCGTDFDSMRVIDVIQYGRSLGVRTAGLLDHWVNYRQRFGNSDDWLSNLPDEVWVVDQYAHTLAIAEGFPENRIRMKSNAYLEFLNESTGELRRSANCSRDGNLLYLSEPIVDDKTARARGDKPWGYSEYSLIEDLLAALPDLDEVISHVRIRLHPKEPSNKYASLISEHEYELPIEMSVNEELVDDLIWADVVVGSHSMGLVAAETVGVPAVSCLPATGKPCVLPHDQIIKINDYLELIGMLPTLESDRSVDD